MRALCVVLALLSAGCVVPGLTQNELPVDLRLDAVPEGAVVESVEGGLRLVFDAVDLPFERDITIPPGTTLVRATGIVAEGSGVSVSMRHADTLRRRCNFAPLDAWDAPVLGRGSCTGVTLVDALPAVWQVRAFSPDATGRVEVELLATPLDGALARLDVSQLSKREHELEPTKVLKVPSFDGTPLHVEVTLPKGPGPWPTILASSPYNHDDRLASGMPAMWSYFTRDWAERGYAVVNADVRGYGFSEGCVEVWGPNEQADQVFLVEWVAKQEWSDGNVGFYGQSYVGTTPVEAAVNGPEALKAIIAVAPVTDAYNDWHFGGVPNGEGSGSPVAYYQTGAGMPFPPLGSTEPADYAWLIESTPYFAQRADNGFCDPTVLARPNDPRALYNDFFAERNFSARAGDVRAAVLYTEGFEDANVKSALIPDWFNAITAPKLGLFGHWVHQHPTRADNEALFLLWLDQHVKGKPVGFETLPSVRVVTNDGRERVADAWPPLAPEVASLHLDPVRGRLAAEEASGSATLVMDPIRGALPLSLGDAPLLTTRLVMESEPLAAPLHLAGSAVVSVEATLQRAQNAYVAAYLRETADGETRLVAWGMFNLAHRQGHDRYVPVTPGERLHFGIPLLPTEYVFAEGAVLSLELRGAAVADWALTPPTEPGALDVHAKGSTLRFPLAEGGEPLPATAQR